MPPRRTPEKAPDLAAEKSVHYQVLFARHPHPMWVFDPKSLRILAANDAAVTIRLLDRDTGELEAAACWNIDADEWRSENANPSHKFASAVLEKKLPKLKQVLQNLIDNAIKFRPEGSVTISARVVPEQQSLEIKVRDRQVAEGSWQIAYSDEKRNLHCHSRSKAFWENSASDWLKAASPHVLNLLAK